MGLLTDDERAALDESFEADRRTRLAALRERCHC